MRRSPRRVVFHLLFVISTLAACAESSTRDDASPPVDLPVAADSTIVDGGTSIDATDGGSPVDATDGGSSVDASDGGSPVDASDGGPWISCDEYARELARLDCAQRYDCTLGDDARAEFDMDGCIALSAPWPPCPPFPSVVYDGYAAARCIATRRTGCVFGTADGWRPAQHRVGDCGSVLSFPSPTVGLDERCGFLVGTCGPHLHCTATGDSCGTCQPTVPLGAACSGSNCDPVGPTPDTDVYCDGGVCVAASYQGRFVDAGEPCGAQIDAAGVRYEALCAPPYYCNLSALSSVCQSPHGLGDACQYGGGGGNCGLDLVCDRRVVSATCVQLVVQAHDGEACDDVTPICDPSLNLFCNAGTCASRDTPVGGACGSGGLGPFCAPGLLCDPATSLCMEPPPPPPPSALLPCH